MRGKFKAVVGRRWAHVSDFVFQMQLGGTAVALRLQHLGNPIATEVSEELERDNYRSTSTPMKL